MTSLVVKFIDFKHFRFVNLDFKSMQDLTAFLQFALWLRIWRLSSLLFFYHYRCDQSLFQLEFHHCKSPKLIYGQEHFFLWLTNFPYRPHHISHLIFNSNLWNLFGDVNNISISRRCILGINWMSLVNTVIYYNFSHIIYSRVLLLCQFYYFRKNLKKS